MATLDHLVIANLLQENKSKALQVSLLSPLNVLAIVSRILTYRLRTPTQLLKRMFYMQVDAYGSEDKRCKLTSEKIAMLQHKPQDAPSSEEEGMGRNEEDPEEGVPGEEEDAPEDEQDVFDDRIVQILPLDPAAVAEEEPLKEELSSQKGKKAGRTKFAAFRSLRKKLVDGKSQ